MKNARKPYGKHWLYRNVFILIQFQPGENILQRNITDNPVIVNGRFSFIPNPSSKIKYDRNVTLKQIAMYYTWPGRDSI